MHIVKESKNGSQVHFEVEVERERVDREMQQAFTKVARQTKVPGFRRGRIPRKLFERRFGTKAIREEALKQLLPALFREVVKEKDLKPIISPELKVEQFADEGPLRVSMEVALAPEVSLGEYKGLKIKRQRVKVSEKETSAALEELRRKYAQYPLVEDRQIVENDDWVLMDWQAFEEGRKLEGRQGENTVFRVGSTSFPEEFSQKLIGARVSEPTTIEVTFPEDYAQEEVRGRTLAFEVTVKEIRGEELPDLDDEFAQELKYKDLKDLRAQVTEQVSAAKQKSEERRVRSELVEQVTAKAELTLPPLLVKRRTEEREQELAERLKQQNDSLDDYLQQQKLTEAEFRQRVEEQIRKELQTLFVLDSIAREEDVQVEDEDIRRRLQELSGKTDPQELATIRKSLQDRGQLDELVMRIRNEKVIELLVDRTVSSKKGT